MAAVALIVSAANTVVILIAGSPCRSVDDPVSGGDVIETWLAAATLSPAHTTVRSK
jgi:hypothetical protein